MSLIQALGALDVPVKLDKWGASPAPGALVQSIYVLCDQGEFLDTLLHFYQGQVAGVW